MSSHQKQTNPANDFRPDPSDPLHLQFGIHEHDTRFIRNLIDQVPRISADYLLNKYSSFATRRERNAYARDFWPIVALMKDSIPPLSYKKVFDEVETLFEDGNEDGSRKIIEAYKILFPLSAKIEEVPFASHQTAYNRLEKLIINDKNIKAANDLIYRLMEKEHNNSLQPAKPRRKGDNRPTRILNSWVCDLDEQGIRVAADEELKQLTERAKIIDANRKSKAALDWFDAMVKAEWPSNRDEFYVDPRSAITELPTELQIIKKYRKIRNQTNDEFAMVLQTIGSDAPYQKIGGWNHKWRQSQVARWKKWGEINSATDPNSGKQIKMSDITKTQKAHRKAELYKMLKDLEKVARSDGLDWAFAVLTAPPRFHSNPAFKQRGVKNKWDGSMPVDSHHFISKKWGQVRDELRLTHDIELAGYRAPEAHLDGTAHLNVFYFCHPAEAATVKAVIAKHFDWHKNAAKILDNDGTSSFATYVMKYALLAPFE